jgi:hypothetical protein
MSLDDLLRRRFTSFRIIHLPTADRLAQHQLELLPTGQRPHFTVRLRSADNPELDRLQAALGAPQANPSTLEARSGERRTEMYRADITVDLNGEDETGYVWTFLDEARDPEQIKPGAIIVAGDQDAAAVCEVIDLAPAGDGTIVHLRLLPGLVEDYRALVERALAS